MVAPEKDPVRWLGVCVGNTRTRFGVFDSTGLRESASIDNADGPLASAVEAAAAGAPVVIATVNTPVADRLAGALPGEVYRLGRDIAIPLVHSLADASTLGQDRALCALGAFRRVRQACIVVDAGTAVTVDFVDGEGVFHGGVIAPGLNMMLRSLHEHTAALPALRYEPPEPGGGVMGKDTASAMRLGAGAAVVGLVHLLIDRYAEFYEAYPRVIATGGDAGTLLGEDPLVEHVVPDLQLLGLEAACRADEDLGLAGPEEP